MELKPQSQAHTGLSPVRNEAFGGDRTMGNYGGDRSGNFGGGRQMGGQGGQMGGNYGGGGGNRGYQQQSILLFSFVCFLLTKTMIKNKLIS